MEQKENKVGIKGWIAVIILGATMIPVDMLRKLITKSK